MNIFETVIQKFRGAAPSLKEPEWWRQNGYTGESSSGVFVNDSTALQFSAVFACVRVLSETVASLPIHVYRKTSAGRKAIPNHPLSRVLGIQPNEEQTSYELREFMMTSLGLRGNAYSQIILDRMGRTVELNPLYAKYMHVDRDSKGNLVFDYQEPSNSRTFRAEELWRVAGLGSNGITGLSPISIASESIGLALATERAAGSMFKNGLQTNVALEYPTTVTTEQIENLRSQFAENYGGSNKSGKPLILEGGMSTKKIGLSAQDAQMLAQRRYNVVDICRWYRIPPHMVAELERSTFSNIEHQGIEFVVHTIRPWLVRLESTMQRDLLNTGEQGKIYISHNVDGLLRGDTKSRYEAYGKAINDGWMNRNEVRGLEDLPNEEGLNEFLVPMNMGGSSDDVHEEDEPTKAEPLPEESTANSRFIRVLVDREMKALQTGAKKEDFGAWAEDYYNRHIDFLKDATEAEDDDLVTYCENRIRLIKLQGADSLVLIGENINEEIGGLL